MRKEIYLVRGKEGEDYRAFTDRIMQTGRDAVKALRPLALKITVTEAAPPRFSVIPFRKDKIAVISVYRDNSVTEDFFHDVEGISGAFKVDEAIPVSYRKEWPDGDPTPGVCLLTLFRRKPGINYNLFIHRWHNGHTPLSLKIHPLWNYNRNVVLQKMCDSDIWYDGIVEEQTRTRETLTNPFKFFGSFPVIIGNMIAVYRDVSSFIHYKSIETYLTIEYHILSNETPSQNP